ncbi:uncharacterized protein LOC143018992 [Oratosquilla oratoria]|uniref:uncharacterized protein LOC143018992 n=1 Tax=Oratosquilla oratoria TaxID=337810 RepID=UPI003F7657C1
MIRVVNPIDISTHLQTLQSTNEFCDMLIELHGYQWAAHTCVLAPQSSVLSSIFKDRVETQQKWSILQPLIISLDGLTLPDQSEETWLQVKTVTHLLSFLYGEIVTLSHTEVKDLSVLGEMLGLPEKSRSCFNVALTDSQSQAGNSSSSEKRKTKMSRKKSRQSASVPPLKMAKNSEVSVHPTSFSTKAEQISDDVNTSTQNYFTPDSKNIKIEVESQQHSNDQVTLDLIFLGGEGMNSNIDFKSTLVDIPRSTDEMAQDTEKLLSEALNSSSSVFSECSSNDVKEVQDSRDTKQQAVVMSTKEDCNTHLPQMLSIPLPSQRPTEVDNDKVNRVVNNSDVENPRSKKNLTCGVCTTAFRRSINLVRHVLDKGHFTSKCPICFEHNDEYEEQKVHFALHDDDRPFFCNYCDQRFHNRFSLAMHAPKHYVIKPFVCSVCGRGFKWKHALQAHQSTHSSVKHLLCDICGYSSKYTANFKAHLLTHTGRYFKCPHQGCSFRSLRKAHLNDHVTTHTKVRVYQCEVCGHSFSQAKNMRRHMKLHAPNLHFLRCVSFSASLCTFKTTRPDKLRAHLACKHDINIESSRLRLESNILLQLDKMENKELGILEKDKENVDKDGDSKSDNENLSVILMDKGSTSVLQELGDSTVVDSLANTDVNEQNASPAQNSAVGESLSGMSQKKENAHPVSEQELPLHSSSSSEPISVVSQSQANTNGAQACSLASSPTDSCSLLNGKTLTCSLVVSQQDTCSLVSGQAEACSLLSNQTEPCSLVINQSDSCQPGELMDSASADMFSQLLQSTEEMMSCQGSDSCLESTCGPSTILHTPSTSTHLETPLLQGQDILQAQTLVNTPQHSHTSGFSPTHRTIVLVRQALHHHSPHDLHTSHEMHTNHDLHTNHELHNNHNLHSSHEIHSNDLHSNQDLHLSAQTLHHDDDSFLLDSVTAATNDIEDHQVHTPPPPPSLHSLEPQEASLGNQIGVHLAASNHDPLDVGVVGVGGLETPVGSVNPPPDPSLVEADESEMEEGEQDGNTLEDEDTTSIVVPLPSLNAVNLETLSYSWPS